MLRWLLSQVAAVGSTSRHPLARLPPNWMASSASKGPSKARATTSTTQVPSFHDSRTHVPGKQQAKVILVPQAIDLLEEGKGHKDESEHPPIISTSRTHSHAAESTAASSEVGGGSTGACAKTTLVHPLMILVQMLFSGEEKRLDLSHQRVGEVVRVLGNEGGRAPRSWP